MVTKTPDHYNMMKTLRTDLVRFMMSYKFALEEINTKIHILKEEFQYVHDYNPIEHVKSRVKSPESLINKLQRKELEISIDSIQQNIRDIAGVRITCSFVSDIYEIKNKAKRISPFWNTRIISSIQSQMVIKACI